MQRQKEGVGVISHDKLGKGEHFNIKSQSMKEEVGGSADVVCRCQALEGGIRPIVL